MALIPLEGLGAPSQKTSLLGGVAQILIFSRPSPRLVDVGLFVRPKSQHIGHVGSTENKNKSIISKLKGYDVSENPSKIKLREMSIFNTQL